MSQHDYENSKDAMNEQAKRNYRSEIDGTENSEKGFHMYKTPYLWEEENPISNMDTPTENFIPTPTYNVSDVPKSKVKKVLKIALIVLAVGFLVYAGIALLIESPEVFGFHPDKRIKWW